MSAPERAINPEVVEQKAGLVFGFLAGAVTSSTIWMGDELGLYRAMRGAGPLSPNDLAAQTGLSERWLREWLEGQAAAALIDYAGGKFELSPESALVLADEDNPASAIGAFSDFPSQFGDAVARVPQAFRTGRGFTYDDGGDGVARGVERMFGPWHKTMLTSVAIPALPGVVDVLNAGGKVADVGCGGGLAGIAVARAFANATVDGYDTSKIALGRARANIAAAGVASMRVHNPDDGDGLPDTPTFDLVMCLDCLHDMARPDLVAAAIRKAIKPTGTWFIVDVESAGFEGNLANPLAPMMYGFSLISCLSSSAATEDGLALGTVGLPEPKMRELVLAAGFSSFERVPGLAHPFNAFYLARP